MKCFIILCLIIGSVVAEPPRFRSSRLRSRFLARQETVPESPPPEAEATTVPAEEAPYPPAGAPYPPSGWKPTGQAFELPAPKEEQPDNAYGAPVNAYGPPTNEYGPPSEEDVTTVEPLSENIDQPPSEQSARFRKFQKSQRQVLQRQTDNRNSFYILLPDSTLQRVEIAPTGARINSRVSARILQEVQPFNGRLVRRF